MILTRSAEVHEDREPFEPMMALGRMVMEDAQRTGFDLLHKRPPRNICLASCLLRGA